MSTDSFGRWEENYRGAMPRLRELRGMTQTDLARWLRDRGLPFHQQTVQKIESGERPVRLNEAHLIAEALGSDVHSMTASGPASEQELLFTTALIAREGLDFADVTTANAVEWVARVEAFAFEFLREDVDQLDGPSLLWVGAWVHKILRLWRAVLGVTVGAGELMGASRMAMPAHTDVFMDLAEWVTRVPPSGPDGDQGLVMRLSDVPPNVLRAMLVDPVKVDVPELQKAGITEPEAEWTLSMFRERHQAHGEHPEA